MDAVLNWLWQGGVVAGTAFVMLLALERARANVRYTVCWATSLIVAGLPALPSLPSTPVAREVWLAAPDGAMVSLPDAWWTSPLVVLAAWILWAGVHLVRFVSALVTIRRARRRTRPFPSRVESALPHWLRVRSEGRRATLVLSDSVAAAAVLGSGAPMIAVAPSLVRTLDPDELDRVLVHEWAHVQRRDDVVNILQIVVRTVAGWHPALWWIDRRLHLEREIACDEMTVAITGSPKSYAACLLKLASLDDPPRAMQAAPAVLAPSGLGARVIKIVSPPAAIAPAWSRGIAAGTVMTLCGMSVTVAGLTLVEATAFVQPLVARALPATTPYSPVPVATLAAASTATTKRPSRRTLAPTAPASLPQDPAAEPPSVLPEPHSEPVAPPPADGSLPASSTPAAEPDAEAAVNADVVRVPDPPAPDAGVNAQSLRSPWSAAATGGVAIGRKSKAAGVATAGFFSRFARRVAGSF